ncbi:MAG: GTP 3',8-cyclase MoaA [FCB group bacterium]|nr:GTP 3',8-cyclase MoaA [FCB group bacterium]
MIPLNNQPKTLIDPMGRSITYLRVSLTAKCNLRCSYCYGTGKDNSISSDHLSTTDVIRLIEVFASLGINKIRFTGGEPLMRRDIVDLVRRTAKMEGINQIGLTTNGLVLEPLLPSLIEAGLNCLNISLDTLKRETFRQITGSDGFDRVYSAIISAEECGTFKRVKVNTVVMRGINDEEVRQFTLWALERRIDLRFIEFMPTQQSGWDKSRLVNEDMIKDLIGLDLEPVKGNDNSPGPASSYTLPGAPGRISFISTISHNFCGRCNRLRLTSTGQLVGCLFLNQPADLKKMLAEVDDIKDIAEQIRDIVARPGFRRPPQELPVIGFNPFMRKVGG